VWDDWHAIERAQVEADAQNGHRRPRTPDPGPTPIRVLPDPPKPTPAQYDSRATVERQRREWEAARAPVDDVTGLKLYLRLLRGMAMRSLQNREGDK
jgi:hypothetical protein